MAATSTKSIAEEIIDAIKDKTYDSCVSNLTKTHSTKSIAEEIIDAIKDKTYDSCVSNLTKTHRVNLKNFRRERLPEGTWITTKRFVSKMNHPVPNAMFELFGEFSNQSRPEVRDTMIGWSYDNFCMLEGVFSVALSQRNTNLHAWLNIMADEHTPVMN